MSVTSTQKWNKWDSISNPPLPYAFLSTTGWRIPLEGTNPQRGLTELIITLKNSIVLFELPYADSDKFTSDNSIKFV